MNKPSSLYLVSSSASPPANRRVPIGRLGVVEQVRTALRPENRLAALAGFLLGGFVPLAAYVVSHVEYDAARPWYAQPATALVLGGMAYSARTVYEWGVLAFGLRLKALGFVVLVEGTMILSSTRWLGLAALAYLVAINGIGTGTRLALHGRGEGR